MADDRVRNIADDFSIFGCYTGIVKNYARAFPIAGGVLLLCPERRKPYAI